MRPRFRKKNYDGETPSLLQTGWTNGMDFSLSSQTGKTSPQVLNKKMLFIANTDLYFFDLGNQ